MQDAPKLVGDEEFDLVFSNSLIEHLGGHAAARASPSVSLHGPRLRRADALPVLPGGAPLGVPRDAVPALERPQLARPRWPLGHTHGWPAAEAEEEVMFTDLLSLTEMRTYFPDAHIEWERLAGLRKSMTAFR